MRTGRIGLWARLLLVVVTLIAIFSVVRLAPGAAPSSVQSGTEVMFALSSFTNPNLLTIDPSTGVVSQTVPISNEEALNGLAYDGRRLWSIDGYNDGASDRTFVIKPSTGVGTVVGDTGFNWNFRSVAIHPHTGVLYGMTDNELYTINKSTGAAASIATISGEVLSNVVD